MKHLFFSGKGQISQRDFIVGLVIAAFVIFAINSGLRAMSGTMTAFYIALFFPFIALYVLYCLSAKRLRDMGRSPAYFFGLLALQFLAVIFVMLSFGGAEYFAAFSEFDRKQAIDPNVTQAIIAEYEANLSANALIIRICLLTLPLIYVAWLSLTPTHETSN